MDMTYADLRAGLFGLGVHRGALFMLLFEALRREEIAVRRGAAVVALERGAAGTVLLDGTGRRHGPYVLLVAADGARSALRGLSGLSHRVDRYPWGALWAIVEQPGEAFATALSQVYRGTREMVGFLPTGRSAHLAGDRPTLSLFWSVRADRLARWRERGLDAWREEVRALAPHAEPVLAQIGSPEEVFFAAYDDVRMPRWHADDVVVIGDAGHAMSPQLGQGANLALLDAWALGRYLAGNPNRRELPARLRRYQRERRGNLRFYAAPAAGSRRCSSRARRGWDRCATR
jgi:2-polyprenyl-6-methoxyphenol hydroxylase-like FAD-dependent oxidoreductase